MQIIYNLDLAQFYMWAQTDDLVFLAVHVPTGQHRHMLLNQQIACLGSCSQTMHAFR